MIIQQANLALSQQHTLRQRRETREQFRLNATLLSTEQAPVDAPQTVSINATNALTQNTPTIVPVTAETVDNDAQISTVTIDFKLSLIKGILEHLTGKKIRLYQPTQGQAETATAQETTPGAEQSSRLQFRLSVDYQIISRFEEQESSRFAAVGTVITDDGRQLNINITLDQQRSFSSETQLHLQIGERPIDPLVINLNGEATQLTEQRHPFDLDADGQQEHITFVQPGSGFLALDRNGDGIINNGSELFGPTTGQGFVELAQYDQDGNQFIDAGDDIYHRLQIFNKDQDGNDRLIALADADVGAIFLGNIDTPFALKDAQNTTLGNIRRTSVYLTESGAVGTVQEIDLIA